jgi:proteic killer suppression protein|tara:strand:- start:3069 stop:3371 length:303 start_codon:yes stop_codon:yes gene_type:complete
MKGITLHAMIRSFRSKALKRMILHGDLSKLSVPNVARLARILEQLDEATAPEEMNVPGWRFHGLKGRDRGRFAVDASGNWRITFGWDGADAIDVDLEDYH